MQTPSFDKKVFKDEMMLLNKVNAQALKKVSDFFASPT